MRIKREKEEWRSEDDVLGDEKERKKNRMMRWKRGIRGGKR